MDPNADFAETSPASADREMSINRADKETDQDNNNRVVQSLWIGTNLSVMEQLSIASFLRNGHQFHLYTYNELPNVPHGTIIKDGNEILPASAIFRYRDRPSYAGFSNFFRYKLLLERGGWWVDADIVCLRPFDFVEEYVISSQKNSADQIPNVVAIKAPRGSDAIAYAWHVCQTKDPAKLVWGEIGPRLMHEVVTKYNLEKYLKPYYTFCPISFPDWHTVLRPYVSGLHEDAYAIHLWNEMWRIGNQDKNGAYHPACIYEQLKSKYLN